MRRLVPLLALLALILPGCSVFDVTPGASQEAYVGDVVVAMEICASHPVSADYNCANGSKGAANEYASTDSNNDGTPENAQIQLLVGVRIPAAATPPGTFTSTNPQLTFDPHPQFTAELQEADPAGPGKKWAGYLSRAFTYNSGSGAQSTQLQMRFRLNRAANGAPFQSPFRYLATVGFRFVNGSYPASRPVVCDEEVLSSSSESNSTFCSDDPSDENSPYNLPPDLILTTRDFGVVANGAAATIPAGGMASLNFLAALSGPDHSAIQLDLSATTNIPGGTAAVTPNEVDPGADSQTPLSVAVGVPAGTPPGQYTTTVSATMPNGQKRMTVGTVTVPAPPAGGGDGGGGGGTGGGGDGGGGTGGGDGGGGSPTTPVVSLVVPKGVTAKAARRKGLLVLVGSTAAAPAKVVAKQGKRRRARKSVTLKAPGPLKVRLRSRRYKPGIVKVTVSGNGFTKTKRLRLKR